MTANQERIEELQEKKSEFVLNESVYEDDNPSWAEVAEAEDEAEARWNKTEDGRELNALLWAEGNEGIMSLYYALRAMSHAFDIGQRATYNSAIGRTRDVLREAEGAE